MSNLNVNLQPENIVSKLKILANITDKNCVINEEEWQLLAKELKNNFYKNMAFRESQPFYNILNNNRLNKIYNLLMDKIRS